MDWLYEWVISGLDLNLQLQAGRTPFLDAFFGLLTILGDEEFHLAILPIFYWLIHKDFGRRLAYLFVAATYINIFLKGLFALPRPFQADARIVPLVDEISYGLPSGHAQVPLAIWGYVVWVWRETSRWLLLLVILLVALIGFGRIYLGVHFVADTVVGLIVGLLTLILWLIYQPGIEERIRRLSARQQLLLAIAVPLLLLVLVGADPLGYPSEDSATITGVMLGMSVGFYYEIRRLRFKTEGSGFQKVLRYLVGIVMVLFVWGGLRVLFGMVDASHPIEIALRFIRYSLTACVVAWWAPAVFVRLGLAEQEKSAMVG